MKTQSELKLFKSGDYSYIYIYYKLDGNTIRINTKNKYVKHLVRKDLYYNSSMPDYKELNARTEELKVRVDKYIRIQLKEPHPKVSQKDCLEYIDEKHYHKNEFIPGYVRISDYTQRNQPEKTVAEFLDDFLEEKKQQLNYNYHSYKKYITLKNGLIDFEKKAGHILNFELMNRRKFIYDFRDYLLDKGYNDNAVNMRIKNLKTFFRYIQEIEIFNFNHIVFDTKISTYENDVVALSKQEIQELMGLDINKPEWQKLIDVFVANCFMGLRHGDLKTLNQGEFKEDENGNTAYFKENNKTGVKIEVPIVEPALSILNKYNFKLPVYSNQYFNRELKVIMEHFKLFPDKIKKKRKANAEDKSEYFMKRELISSHTSRKTFVTLAIEADVPLNNIMKATGHRKLSTLDSYVEKKQDYEKFSKLGI